MKNGILRLAVCLLALASLNLACTSSDSGDSDTGKRIVILTNGTSPFWDAAKIGAQNAAKDLDVAKSGLRVVVETNDFSDKGQVDALVRYLGATDIVGVGVSVTNSNNPTIADKMRELQKKGIHVIAIDSDVNRENDRDSRAAYVGTDNIYGGQELGKAAKALRPEGGKYVTFVGLKGAANAIERVGGFKEGAGDKFTALEHFGDGGDPVVARTQVNEALDRNKDLDTLVGIWSYNAPAIVDIVKKRDRRKDFTIVTFDAEPIAIKHMEEGQIDAMAVQNPYSMGYEGVRLLKALHENDTAAVEAMQKSMNRGAEKDIYDTGLKIIIPDKGSPLAETKFGDNTEKMTLSKFAEWLAKTGLQGS